MKAIEFVTFAVLLAGLAAVPGCKQDVSSPQVGIVAEAEDGVSVGDPVPSVGFYRPDGRRVTLNSIRGDVSILAIVGSETPEVCLLSANVLALAEKYSGLTTKVMFICVSEPLSEVCDIETNVVEKCALKSIRVIGLCDAGSRVRKAFGARETGVYYLIGADGRVANMGRLDDFAGMEHALRKAIKAHGASLPSHTASHNWRQVTGEGQ